MYILWFWIYIMRCLDVEPYLPKDSNQQTVPPAFEYSDPFKIASNLHDILLKHDVCIYIYCNRERESYIFT